MSSPQKPQLRVYSLIPRDKDSPFWLHIGWAYENKDGNGFTLRLQALPLNDKLVIREYIPEEGLESAPEDDKPIQKGKISKSAKADA